MHIVPSLEERGGGRQIWGRKQLHAACMLPTTLWECKRQRAKSQERGESEKHFSLIALSKALSFFLSSFQESFHDCPAASRQMKPVAPTLVMEEMRFVLNLQKTKRSDADVDVNFEEFAFHST
jgi:hypothetical protein